MYEYTEFDHAFLTQRNTQFRAQVARRLDGSLSEEEFRPLRLMNGLYLQLHAYMLRVAVPYGTLSSKQIRKLAEISERWDKGYGHFTTRQNMQFNWPALRDVPDIMDALASAGMHAVQTSGNTIRNVTADPFAGAAADEVADPRHLAELIRQWSTDHPEFQFLGRKFKIAVTGSPHDRAVIRTNDIGLRVVERDGARGVQVFVGGGLGRTPLVAQEIRDFLPLDDLLPYLESILTVYNRLGRRDNKWKARIKILVQEHGIARIRELVEEEFPQRRATYAPDIVARQLELVAARFAQPVLKSAPTDPFTQAYDSDPVFRSWSDTNLAAHRDPDHAIVTISLKAHGATPGDVSADQMRLLADLAERYAHSELRVSPEQNVILPHVHKSDLPALHAALKLAGLGTANIGLASDIVACPGMDYCSLATARSIPVAQQIAERVDALKLEHDIGALKIRISGCINACGHHHVGHIGILGLDRAGVENYQITLGGDGSENTTIGARTGRGFAHDEIVPAIERLVHAYLDLRSDAEETFLQTLHRLGADPFKAALYPQTAIAAE
ncbi:nitrite/sulfite reductase [Pontibaca salina]|uniref:Nitrite/sulfite reductase n=1 Tax=Pontibaca salina TaxID=2795731 RepID=A0A934LZE0_9RHOB|nr:nitrite/sulfite reductase [Pontibaca salina]MBI6628900.1 nitrite/sulfite reductase [Pontibaca salina]